METQAINNVYEQQNELVKNIQHDHKDNTSYKLLLNQYEGLILKLSSKNYKMASFNRELSITMDDIVVYAKWSLYRRTLKYDINQKMHYSSYLQRFIDFDIKNYIRGYTCRRNWATNCRVDLEEERIVSTTDNQMTLEDINIKSLNKEQLKIWNSYKNNLNVEITAKELNLGVKTLYRKLLVIKEKLINDNK